MTIDEAIRLNAALRKDLIQKGLTSCAESTQLGIEALKLTKIARTKPGGMFFHDLPGETKE